MDVNTQTAVLDEKETNSGESWGSFAWFMIKVLIAVLIFRTLVFSLFSIPSESMLPRLMNGDILLAAKWSYGISGNSLPFDAGLPDGRIFANDPERGDIVIFKHPIDKTDYIKRIVGLPGDSVAVVGGKIVLNGSAIAQQERDDIEVELSANTGCAWGGETVESAAGDLTCSYQAASETLPEGKTYDVIDFGPTGGDTIAPISVPEGHMFVMGDNRDNSRDSRFEARTGDAVGLVPLDNLVGEAWYIVWSSDGSGEWVKPWTWFSGTRWDRIGMEL